MKKMMRKTTPFIVTLLFIILTSLAYAQDATLCPEQRTEMCTRDYTPVCGLSDSGSKTYSNACTACADKSVFSYTSGECPVHTLTTEEVFLLFSDQTYKAIIPSRNLEMTVYVDPDGTMRGMQAGHKFSSNWKINSEGQICVSYKDKMHCRFVMQENKQYKKYKLNEQGDKVVLVIYQSFAAGNIYNY